MENKPLDDNTHMAKYKQKYAFHPIYFLWRVLFIFKAFFPPKLASLCCYFALAN